MLYERPPYHPDETPKRALTENDIRFLMVLQKELNTQDTACTRDPRYWVLMHQVELPASADCCDGWQLLYDGDIIAEDISSAIHQLKLLIPDSMTNQDIDTNNIETSDLDYILEKRTPDESLLDLQVIPVQYHQEIVPNAVFLTRKDALRHLEINRHNYSDNVYPYCMHADRGPTFERLIQILQQVDWDSLIK